MLDNNKTLSINGDRLWSTIMRSGEIGPGRSIGLRRLALTDADKEMRDLFVSWCEQADCEVSIDQVGNIFARRAGINPELNSVLIGSHLDTQVAGGKYDGILGVLAGLEIVRTLNDHDVQTQHPIEVVCWTNEEGARFQPPMMASAAFAGVLDVNQVLNCRDDDGAVLGEELKRIGYAGDIPVGGRELDSYFELHIEQGPELEQHGIDVGVVTGGFTTHGMHIDILGETAHSGPTPMDKRKNALVGAAMLFVAVNDIGWKYHPQGRSTAARIQAWPNKPGILCDYAQVSVDVRHPDPTQAGLMLEELNHAIDDCSKRANVEIQIVQQWQFGSEIFDPECIELICSTCEQMNIPYEKMLSIAGHDAYHLTRVAPSALIFSPCKDGVSHNENEHIELSYTLPSVNVLLNAVVRRACRS